MTMFRVVPDQLRISEGWVRCGQCDEVFDASANMQEQNIDNEASKPAATIETLEPVASIQQFEHPEVERSHVLRRDGPLRIEPRLGQETSELDLLDSSLQIQKSSDETILGESFIQELARTDDSLYTKPEETTHQPSFMRGKPSAALKRKPWVTVGLVFSALLLSAALLLQVFLHERDRIAARAPEIKPVLFWACELVQCVVSPFRQIESIVIDSASFNKLQGDVYRLNFALKNTAQFALAMPSIELSLTDVQDQALMRRVIRADELGSKSGSLESASDFTASLTLSAITPEGSNPVAGYRVLAFYP